MTANEAPVELVGYKADDDVILARRAGEPSFVGVQDVGDGYQAALSRGVDLVATQAAVSQLLADEAIEPRDVKLITIIPDTQI